MNNVLQKELALIDNQHPNLDELLEYSRMPEDASFAALRNHLLCCDSCKNQLDQLYCLKNSNFTANKGDVVAENLALEKIAAFVNGDLKNDEYEKIEKTIQSDQAVQASVLHYALHSQGMSSVTPGAKKETSSVRSKNNLLSFLGKLIDWKAPIWITAPLVAMFVLTVINQVAVSPNVQKNIIIAYQNEPVIAFKNKTADLPGVGFFSGARSSEKNFEGIRISITDDKLYISWPPVPNALEYQFTIIQPSDAGLVAVAEKTDTKNETYFVNLSLESLKPYQWILQGTTSDDKFFEAKGGFVVGDLGKE